MPRAPSSARSAAASAATDVARLKAELEELKLEHDDLKLLYEAMIEHGEAVEDQLAENNILLQQTQRRLEAELADAARYVMSILPEKRQAGPATDWLLVPSNELGGDSFGYHDIGPDHLAIYLIDVCGHGVGAALLSVTVMNVLRAASLPNTDFRDPSAVLAALNDAFPMERQDNMFFTCWYGVYQRSSGELRYASGGHPPALLLRKGRGKAKPGWSGLETPDGMAIGALPDTVYATAAAAIRRGDRLLVLSDGTFEVDDAEGRQLGLEALAAHCAEVRDGLPEIFGWVRDYGGGRSLPDDFSLLQILF